ncbi:MAG: hypothetical protein K0Q79_2323 [Flavipsychrobacter sp.]|jgi:hypothetical protein|nr:hypothetical protein [Flavipsychrobacter sp.]
MTHSAFQVAQQKNINRKSFIQIYTPFPRCWSCTNNLVPRQSMGYSALFTIIYDSDTVICCAISIFLGHS